LAGLEDQPCAGRPPTGTPEQAAKVIATPLTDPKTLDLPFASWMLDRRKAAVGEVVPLEITPAPFDGVELGGVLGHHSSVSQGRSASALLASLLVGIGLRRCRPVSSTIRCGWSRSRWP
jgi:hypothetical protein